MMTWSRICRVKIWVDKSACIEFLTWMEPASVANSWMLSDEEPADDEVFSSQSFLTPHRRKGELLQTKIN